MLNNEISNPISSIISNSSKKGLLECSQSGKKRLRKELDLYSFEISSLSKRNHKLEYTIESLKKEIKRSKKTIDSLKVSKIRQDRKTNWLLRKVGNLKKQGEDYLDDLNDLEDKCSDYENRIDELEDRIGSLIEQKNKFKMMLGPNTISRAYLKQNETPIHESTIDESCKPQNSTIDETHFFINQNSDIRPYQLLLNEVSGLLRWPISHDQLLNPVILPSGHTIEESYFDTLVMCNESDPFSREPLVCNKVVNRFAKSLIEIIEKIHKSFPEAKLDCLTKNEDEEIPNSTADSDDLLKRLKCILSRI